MDVIFGNNGIMLELAQLFLIAVLALIVISNNEEIGRIKNDLYGEDE